MYYLRDFASLLIAKKCCHVTSNSRLSPQSRCHCTSTSHLDFPKFTFNRFITTHMTISQMEEALKPPSILNAYKRMCLSSADYAENTPFPSALC
jgi:hypothetical protein